MSTIETIAATDGLLVLKRCPSCDYSLVGLPREGTCPECGKAYVQGTVVLRGWGRGSMANVFTAPTQLFALMSLTWAALLLGPFLIMSESTHTLSSPSFLGLIFVIGFVVFEITWRVNRGSAVPPLEVRLNALGCAQSIDVSHERNALQIVLKRLMFVLIVGYFVFQIIGGLFPWRFLFIGGIIGLAGLWTRRQAAKHDWRDHWRDPSTVALIIEGTQLEPTLWTKVKAVSFERVARNRCRLRVSIHGGWMTADPIDFEFCADDAHIAELGRQIATWRQALPVAQP